MKSKKCLESHPSEGLRKLIIKNAQTKSEIKTNIALNEILKRIPGQENNFIGGNGHVLSKSSHPTYPNNHQFQNSRPPFNPRPRNTNNQVPEFNFNFPPPGLAQIHSAAPPQPQNIVVNQAQHSTPPCWPCSTPAGHTQQFLTQPHYNIPAQY